MIDIINAYQFYGKPDNSAENFNGKVKLLRKKGNTIRGITFYYICTEMYYNII